jgi:hypothetical protein
MPIMGNWIAANRKGQANSLSLKERVSFLYPQHGISWLSGPARGGPEGGDEEKCGKIE